MYFQMNTIAPPATIPASAPCKVVRFQNKAQIMTPANAAPIPAHAKDTIPNTLELGSLARNSPITAIPRMVPRAIRRLCFSLNFFPKKSCTIFSDTPEAATSIWLSAVDMVAARIPARITPPRTAASTPFLLSSLVRAMMTRSLSSNGAMPPAFTTARPTIPIKIAIPMAKVTQMEATRLERTSFFSSSIDMKRTRI